jgi:hypothetical protein
MIVKDIKAKWQRDHCPVATITIEHNNTPAHFGEDEPRFLAAASIDRKWAFHLNEQPAYSPDTNILNLGFFCSLQSFQWTSEVLASVEELMDTMDREFSEYPPNLLNRVWITY